SVVCQSCWPVLRSKASTDCVCSSSSAVARKTRSPTTVGEECPRPGTAVFQTTPCSLLHSSGAGPAAIPFRVGPRHPGQSSRAKRGGSIGEISLLNSATGAVSTGGRRPHPASITTIRIQETLPGKHAVAVELIDCSLKDLFPCGQ